LQSLLNNAFKYTTEGGVTVRASCDVENDTTATIQIEVMDTGSGISESLCQDIGRAFSTSGGHLSGRFGGMGVGLAICKDLVDRMGGKITLRSTDGVGATFKLILAMPKGEVYASEHCNLANKKMLLVNDSVDDRAHLQRYANEWHIKTEITGSVDHAVGMLNTASRENAGFDLVMIDLHKTHGEGLALAKKINNSAELGHLKVVLLAAGRDGLNETLASGSGVDVSIIKPMRKHLVYDALAIALGRQSNVHHQIVTNNTVKSLKDHQTYRALLVEDNEVNQIIAKGALKRLGISTDVTNNGEEAIDAIQDKRYDVVLMDCEMPIMDGFEATRMIRQWEKTQDRHVPIIALTANESTECQKSCLEAGMDDFMQKPFRADELEAILSRFPKESLH
jgi:CheY-like chemotaxis protein